MTKKIKKIDQNNFIGYSVLRKKYKIMHIRFSLYFCPWLITMKKYRRSYTA